MSNSKFIMAQKLQKVQVKLMQEKISETSLDVLLPLIFQKCLEENLTFWFNFMEDAIVLNLRDVANENYELNIRYAYHPVPPISNPGDIEAYKVNVLLNAFLITTDSHVDNVASSAPQKEESNEKPIKESNLVPPPAIRVAIDELEKVGMEITRKNVGDQLNLKQMSQDKRRQCIAYLRDMEV